MMSQERRKGMIRLRSELEICRESSYLKNFGITVGLKDKSNLYEWNCTLIGGRDTPYEGGIFNLRIKFRDDYPNRSPSIFFITPIYHVNVSFTNGAVSFLNINSWNPNISMEEVLAQLFLIFYKPNPYSGYRADLARECKENRELYDNKIKYFTKKYERDNLENNNNEIWDFSYNK